MIKGPLRVDSARLIFSKPCAADAPAIFERFAGDPAATRYMAWPRHRSVLDTYGFISFSDDEWRRWPAGPYVIRLAADGTVVGSTGFSFESPERAITGYILACDVWGHGYATEALRAMVDLAPQLGLRVLTAAVHAGHAASARVLEKCDFAPDRRAVRQMVFPNLGSSDPVDIVDYRLQLRGD